MGFHSKRELDLEGNPGGVILDFETLSGYSTTIATISYRK
jgi:hypothetical protein